MSSALRMQGSSRRLAELWLPLCQKLVSVKSGLQATSGVRPTCDMLRMLSRGGGLIYFWICFGDCSSTTRIHGSRDGDKLDPSDMNITHPASHVLLRRLLQWLQLP